MKVAVLTLTRDRLQYTKHCFAALAEYAGCDYDHWVLDQGSTDGTQKWLLESDCESVGLSDVNLGITRGMNRLLGELDSGYDVIVKMDNDCELTQPDTLRDVCRLSLVDGAILSPRIMGLQHPPTAQGEFMISEEVVLDIPQIGGVFLAAPAHIFNTFRYDETNDKDDVQVCWWWRRQGGRCGYVASIEANHYETTTGQWQRFPEYFARSWSEQGIHPAQWPVSA